MAPQSTSTPMLPLLLSVAASVVAVVYVSPLPTPTPFAVVVKLMPCLSLLLYIWMFQSSNPDCKKELAHTNTVLYLLGLEGNVKEKEQSPKGQSKNTKPVQLRRTLSMNMTRGIVFSMIGDAFLIWHMVDIPFLLGMLAFAFAQFCYIRGMGFERVNKIQGGLLYLVLVSVMAGLLYRAPTLYKATVPLYAALLSTTLWRSLDRLEVSDGRASWKSLALALGAFAFVLSDSSIATFKFVLPTLPVDIEQGIILTTYFTAQVLLVVGAN